MINRVLFLIYLMLIFLFTIIFHGEASNMKQKLKKEFNQIKTIDVIKVKFGSGPDNIGILTPEEANPEGPMSFTLGKDEEIYILDQINSRIQVFKKGKRINTIQIPAEESKDFRDIELTPDNKIILLRRFYIDGREKTALYILDLNGRVLNKISLDDGKLIPDSGMVLGINVIKEGRFSGIWVELGDAGFIRSVRIVSLDRKLFERISVPGRLSLNGKRLLRAEKVGDITAVIYRSEEHSLSKWEPEHIIYFDRSIVHLVGIWDDRKERIYLGAFLEDEDKKKIEKLSNEVVVLSQDLKQMGRVKLFSQEAPHEIWRSIRVSNEGNIYQMFVNKNELVMRKYIFE